MKHNRAIRGEGTPETTWQAWSGLAQAPRLSLAACMEGRKRLVVVAPHPDDEVLQCGGLLGWHAANDGECLVVAVTDGEASHAHCADWNPQQLAAVRRDESSQGLRILANTASVIRLGLPDGKVGTRLLDLAAALMNIVGPEDLVISTYRHDGHPDHEATGQVTSRVCGTMGCKFAEAPVWMWHWAAPGDAVVPWYRLHALELPAACVQAKRRALQAHVSQLGARPDGTGPVLGQSILERAGRNAEYFFI